MPEGDCIVIKVIIKIIKVVTVSLLVGGYIVIKVHAILLLV